MKNSDLVSNLFQILKKMQITNLIVCAGARNIPILAALDQTDFQIQSYFEERSSGFYALGKSKISNQPVAVITTSGTAVAELLPAVIEAFYQNLPLIVISADRPKNYRGSGAPQAIEHVGIFSSYVESTYDWDVFTTDFTIRYTGTKPVHINICFDEPLLDDCLIGAVSSEIQVIKQEKTNKFDEIISIQNPLAIISEIQMSDREFVKNYLLKNQIIHYAEFLSGLRLDPELMHLQICSNEIFINQLFSEKKADSVLRIGGMPTVRFWRDLESVFSHIDVFSFSRTEFSGLSRKNKIFDFKFLKNSEIVKNKIFDLANDQRMHSEKIKLLSELQNSEQNFTRCLSELIFDLPIYVGNSLPIRMWDAFAMPAQKNQSVFANRGANGIDGQVSTYLGWANTMKESWCLVGDLTALYDLAALGLSSESKNKYRLVVMNNSGGQIFNKLFGDGKYLNAQSVKFKSWADMWGWDYIQIETAADFLKLKEIKSNQTIIELNPDNEQTNLFWKKWDLIWKK